MARHKYEIVVECPEKPTQEMLNRVYEEFYAGRRAKKATAPAPETPRPHAHTVPTTQV